MRRIRQVFGHIRKGIRFVSATNRHHGIGITCVVISTRRVAWGVRVACFADGNEISGRNYAAGKDQKDEGEESERKRKTERKNSQGNKGKENRMPSGRFPWKGDYWGSMFTMLVLYSIKTNQKLQ